MRASSREKAWAYLSRVVEPPCAPLTEYLELRDVEEVAFQISNDTLPADQTLLRRLTQARRECHIELRDLATLADLGGRLVTCDSPDWPAWRLLVFDHAQSREETPSTGACALAAPCALWVLGEAPLSLDEGFHCAVVGSRGASAYGERVAAEWAGHIGSAGGTVISGGAHGVDSAAHRGALASHGTTLAVLACGIDVNYPAAHHTLFQRISKQGAVLSEYPPGTQPARHRFLARNRLIAALSSGILVVEAAARSGALNTAHWAHRLGIPVLAVPGSVFSYSSVGCHRLIESGVAEIAYSPDTVLKRVGPLGILGENTVATTRELDTLTPQQHRIYAALESRNPLTMGHISRSSGIPLLHVRADLSLLEIQGWVKEIDTGSWIRSSRTGKD